MKKRFEVIAIRNRHFEIRDNETDEPVIHRGRLLSFESEKRAARIAGFLNDTIAAGWGAQATPDPGDRKPRSKAKTNATIINPGPEGDR